MHCSYHAHVKRGEILHLVLNKNPAVLKETHAPLILSNKSIYKVSGMQIFFHIKVHPIAGWFEKRDSCLFLFESKMKNALL